MPFPEAGHAGVSVSVLALPYSSSPAEGVNTKTTLKRHVHGSPGDAIRLAFHPDGVALTGR
ncbi:MAG TPA: hypothetical protein VL652_42885 [Kutzneria sp.]|jgi:hypothetical protein|nr:hypothetical protein [Kutzneria sp.]